MFPLSAALSMLYALCTGQLLECCCVVQVARPAFQVVRPAFLTYHLTYPNTSHPIPTGSFNCSEEGSDSRGAEQGRDS